MGREGREWEGKWKGWGSGKVEGSTSTFLPAKPLNSTVCGHWPRGVQEETPRPPHLAFMCIPAPYPSHLINSYLSVRTPPCIPLHHSCILPSTGSRPYWCNAYHISSIGVLGPTIVYWTLLNFLYHGFRVSLYMVTCTSDNRLH
jgi:hypothetical protein